MAFLLCALVAGPAESLGASSGSSILEPPSGALLGQYYGAGSVAQATRKLGRTLPIHLTYYAWDADWTGTVTKADMAAGRIPLISWEPHHIDFAKIIDGSLDATIMARAKGSKGLGKKFFLDFAAEMNGDEAWSGNNAPHAMLQDLKQRIHSAQLRASVLVNRDLVLLYWRIGREILLRQAQENWGTKVIDRVGRRSPAGLCRGLAG